MNKTSVETFAVVSESRRNNLDFLRFFFALMVIFAHAYELSGKPEPFSTITRGQGSSGTIAVTGFFLLSGFLITKSWIHTPDLKLFLKKRLLRILPGFIVALLFCVFVVGPLSGVSLAPYFRNQHTYRFLLQGIGMGTTGLPNVFVNNPVAGNVNGSLWTIRIEFICYLLVAFLGVVGALRSRSLILGVLVASFLTLILSKHLPTHIRLPYLIQGILSLAPPFLIGMTFYLYKDIIPRNLKINILSIIFISICCFLGSFLYLVLPICEAYLLFSIGFSSRIKMQNFGRNGDFSYGLYLYAFPVQQLINCYIISELHPIYRFFLALPPTLLLSWMSWNGVEKRFLRGKDKSGLDPKLIVVPAQL